MSNEASTPDNPQPRSWIVTFCTQPEGIEQLPQGRGPGTQREARWNHKLKCFEKLKTMLPAGVTITQDYTAQHGFIFVEGPDKECLELKTAVEKDGWAVMIMDGEYVRTAEGTEDEEWFIRFMTKPEGAKNLPLIPGPGGRYQALKDHYDRCLEELREILGSKVSVINYLELDGSVVVRGPANICQAIKRIVEKDGWALMSKNDPCATTASDKRKWMIRFQTKPANVDSLPLGTGPGTKGEAEDAHFERCCEMLEEMLDPSIAIGNRYKLAQTVTVTGPDDACQRLEERVEKNGWAEMHPEATLIGNIG